VAAPTGFPATVRSLGADRGFFLAHLDEIRHRVNTARGGGPLNILALSGGGAGGAFAAGALSGLSRRGERPQFTVVTGVSTGALLAPFAFLGPPWDTQMKEAFVSARTEHLLRSRGIGVLFGPGVYEGKPLTELVDHYVTEALIQQIALENAKGRMLLIATTDLDKEEPVIWDMGAIASHGGETARTLFRDVLVASASIPGLLPPVLIHVSDSQHSYDEMHVDGATSVPFFFTWQVAPLLTLPVEATDDLKGANLYVIINGQLGTTPQTTPQKTIPILKRGFSTELMQTQRATLELAVEFARLYGMNLQFSRIPPTYPFQGPLNFQPPAMQALFDYAAGCAATGHFWTTPEQVLLRIEQPLGPQTCPGE
jgi:predicted acylesterase/phospholipase RssA